jgi:geranyl diphosphate 2-C-methyltransferase
MIMKITYCIVAFQCFFSSLMFAKEDDYQERIANSYDNKTNDLNGLNFKLAENDGCFFNHNGIVFPGDSMDIYLSRIHSEQDHLNVIHALEKNTARYGLLFLGSPEKSMVLLDAGCGAGGCSLMIHEAFGCKIEGITLSKEQAKFANTVAANRGYGDRVRFFQGDMLNLNKADNMYDVIWACESTEHAQNLEAMFSEFSRVAKPKSRLVIIAWCANDPELKETVDNHYITQIHTVNEYLQASGNAKWKVLHTSDLTQQTAAYWKIRSSSKNVTGSEKFMGPGFSNGTLQYYLFTFENTKE